MIISLSNLAGVLAVTHDALLAGASFGSLSNEQARDFVGETDAALIEQVHTFAALGGDERSVAMFLSRPGLKRAMPVLALGLTRLGDGAVTTRHATTKSQLWAGASFVDGSLSIAEGQTLLVGGDLEVNGWVEVNGALVVAGSLRCVGLEVDTRSDEALPVRRVKTAGSVTTNVLAAGRVAEVEFASVRALVVLSHEGAVAGTVGLDSALWYLERGEVWYDDEEQGAAPFDDAFIEALEVEDDDADVPHQVEVPDLVKLRRALERGEQVFQAPLVPKRIEVKPVEVLPADVGELAQWLGAYPGPQRQLLSDFEMTWLPQVLTLSADARAAAAKLVTRAVKSPKLASDLSRVVSALSSS